MQELRRVAHKLAGAIMWDRGTVHVPQAAEGMKEQTADVPLPHIVEEILEAKQFVDVPLPQAVDDIREVIENPPGALVGAHHGADGRRASADEWKSRGGPLDQIVDARVPPNGDLEVVEITHQ